MHWLVSLPLTRNKEDAWNTLQQISTCAALCAASFAPLQTDAASCVQAPSTHQRCWTLVRIPGGAGILVNTVLQG